MQGDASWQTCAVDAVMIARKNNILMRAEKEKKRHRESELHRHLWRWPNPIFYIGRHGESSGKECALPDKTQSIWLTKYRRTVFLKKHNLFSDLDIASFEKH